MKPIKIKMVLDLNCSWCPIGYKHITKALDNLDLSSESVDFQFLPFRLNPDMPDEGELINTYLKRATGQSDAQLKAYRKGLVTVSNKAGLKINFNNRTHYFNTFQGHGLIEIAQSKSLQREVYEIFCVEYYSNGKRFSEESVMKNVADKLVLTKDRLLNLLEHESVKENIVNKEIYAKSLGINSVPAFLVNDSDLIKGSNSVAFFENYFQKYTETNLQHNQ